MHNLSIGTIVKLMIRTVYFRCRLPQSLADALNLESGRIYAQVLVAHYRIWLSPKAAERLNDSYNAAPTASWESRHGGNEI